MDPGESIENEERFCRQSFRLALALSKVADQFPKGEHLAAILKDRAYQIHYCAVRLEVMPLVLRRPEIDRLISQVSALQEDLDRAESGRLANPLNFQVLKKEYGGLSAICEKMRQGFAEGLPADIPSEKTTEKKYLGYASVPGRLESVFTNGEAVFVQSAGSSTLNKIQLNHRQQNILAFIERAGQANFEELFNGVSKGDIGQRTLQRELNCLIKHGFLLRTGHRRWARYCLPKEVFLALQTKSHDEKMQF